MSFVYTRTHRNKNSLRGETGESRIFILMLCFSWSNHLLDMVFSPRNVYTMRVQL